MVAPHNLTFLSFTSYSNALSFSLIRFVESPRLLFTVVFLFFFVTVVVAFLHRGKYRFERSDGSTFETPIPPFALDSREEDTPDSSGKT